MTISRFSTACRLVLGLLTLANSLAAQADEPTAVRFSRVSSQVGDHVLQQLAVQLDMSTTILQSGQIAHQDKSTLRRQQRRFVEVVEVADGRVRRARVSFPNFRQQSPENQDPAQFEIQAVEGKSYFVERQGERLLVTDPEGAIPPQNEFEIVVNSVSRLGLPDPLAEFLLQRPLRIGDRLQVPKQIAEQIMGFGDSLGQVRKFELELKGLQPVNDQPCAQFVATFEIEGDSSNPLKVHIQGQLVIQVETCRIVEAKLSGPLQMIASERSYESTAEGELKLAIQSHYGSVKR